MNISDMLDKDIPLTKQGPVIVWGYSVGTSFYSTAIQETRKEYARLERRLTILYDDRLDGRITTDEYDNIVSKTKAEMEKLDEKLVQLTNGDKSFVVTSSYLLDLTRIAGKLFRSSKPELKSKILSLVLSNLELDNKKLHFNLLSPFNRLLSYSQSSIWLPLQVTDSITGVEWYKWDTAGVVSKVSHLSRQKKVLMSKAPKKTERKPHEFTEEELRRLVGYFDVLIEMDMKQKKLYRRLEAEPKGFAMPGEGRDCSLCERGVYEGDGWFDKWGFKCSNCQDAVNKRKIPASLCLDHRHEKAVPDTTLAMKLDVKVHTLRKYIREGKIVGRRIPNGPYMILRKDNPNLGEVLRNVTSSGRA